MAFEGTDAESMALIIELQLSDVKSLIKGKGREGETSDKELAVNTYKTELECAARFHADRALSQSMAKAVKLDGDAIRSHVNIEEQAFRDRQQALGSNMNPGNRRNATTRPSNLDQKLMRRLEAMNVYNEESTIAESSSWAASRPRTSRSSETGRRCIACCDMVRSSQLVRCPCSDEYCVNCLVELFRAAMTDETLFPPRCCKQKIPIEPNQEYLPSYIVSQYREKEVEYGTTNRTYCHQATCSAFIPPASIRSDVGTCLSCGYQTCSICKSPSHENECPKDTATQEILRIAAENGWQRCRTCHIMVELETGCNHMTCRCGAQFCYVCGVPWKNCTCAQWDERRLLSRANIIVNRDNHGAPVDEARRRNLVEREARNLIQNHQCEHGRWRSIQGRHECEQCHDTLPEYMYECRQCRIRACRRCRFNRL